mgnify:CR=1 FL=1
MKPEGTLSADLRVTGPVSGPDIQGNVQATGLRAGADWGKGLPAASLPIGTGARGLPIGLQLVGDAWDEATLFAASAELERQGVARALLARGPRLLTA